MSAQIPRSMKAAAFDQFGGPDVFQLKELPVPTPGPKEVLIQLESAGIGAWDPDARAGELELGGERGFPRIIGNDGAGLVVAVGKRVRRFEVGDRVYAYDFEGGFYAEYVAAPEDDVALVPPGVSLREAGALGADGITALRGLTDHLAIRAGEKLMIFGASGGIGHLAVQLAKRLGATVFAIASGTDGVELVRRLGADEAVDGRSEDVGQAARAYAPQGLDAALVLVGGGGVDDALGSVKPGGRVAFPNGVEPEPAAPAGVRVLAYDGTPDRDAFERLNRLIGNEPFHVELGRMFPLSEAATAHRQVGQHHLGKLAFQIRSH
ncbi:MAG TPA: NADP-dependent oxidoreductase [Polyangia bacterium]|jgi:NADPH:quinone reductase-like Zn-dependent oxidoreductase|nr:NADP-dependent oxidoreductase [Polyangia bacterium]